MELGGFGVAETTQFFHFFLVNELQGKPYSFHLESDAGLGLGILNIVGLAVELRFA